MAESNVIDELLAITGGGIADGTDLYPDSFIRKGAGPVPEMVVEGRGGLGGGGAEAGVSPAASFTSGSEASSALVGGSPIDQLIAQSRQAGRARTKELDAQLMDALEERAALLRQGQPDSTPNAGQLIGMALGGILPALLSKGRGAGAGLEAVKEELERASDRAEMARKLLSEELGLSKTVVSELLKEKARAISETEREATGYQMQGLRDEASEERQQRMFAQQNAMFAQQSADINERFRQQMDMQEKRLLKEEDKNVANELKGISTEWRMRTQDSVDQIRNLNQIEYLLTAPPEVLNRNYGVLKNLMMRGVNKERGAASEGDVGRSVEPTLRERVLQARDYIISNPGNISRLSPQSKKAMLQYLRASRALKEEELNNAKTEIVSRAYSSAPTAARKDQLEPFLNNLGTSLDALLRASPIDVGQRNSASGVPPVTPRVIFRSKALADGRTEEELRRLEAKGWIIKD